MSWSNIILYTLNIYFLFLIFFHIFLSRPSTTSSSNARPLQPSTLKATSDGQIKVRLMPSAHGITFTHPVISIQSPSHSPSHNSGKINFRFSYICTHLVIKSRLTEQLSTAKNAIFVQTSHVCACESAIKCQNCTKSQMMLDASLPS